MRQSYLESYYNLLPLSQQARLLKILQSRANAANLTPSSPDIQKQLEELVAGLQKPLGDPLIQLRKAVKFSKLSSKDYNDTMDEAYVDLGALFKQNNLINKTIKTHEMINDAVLRDVRSATSKIENDIMVHKIIKENKTGITYAVYNSFYKNDNQSTDAVYAATTDTDTNSIKLPRGLDQSALSMGGLSMAEISLYHYGGGILGTIEDESHRKEKAIDGSSLTFWGEVILTDEPIRQVYNGETHFGAICEVVLDLFRADQVNHVRFDPFSNYPLTVLAIYYSTTMDGPWIDLGVAQQSSTSMMEFNFSEVYAKRLKIVLNQKNPTINTYKIPRQVVNNAQLWQQIANREYSISTSTAIPIQATQDMIDYVVGWQAYVDATESFRRTLSKIGSPANYSLTGSMSESIYDATTQEMTKSGDSSTISYMKMDLYGKYPELENDFIEARKYEYVYGAYEIDARKIWYLDNGEYISPQYLANGSVIEAQLDVTEIVPSGTSIEYQVATRANEWKNILPSGGYIARERLDVERNTLAGFIRFPCSGSIDGVYSNGIPIGAGSYTFTENDSKVVVGSGWYSATSAFTVSYLPKGVSDVIPSGVMVSFIEDSLQYASETHTGAGSRQYKVELDHYPYIEYHVVNDTTNAGVVSPGFSYEQGRWLNVAASGAYGIDLGDYYDVLSVTVNGYSAENRTDYYEDIRPALTVYDEVGYPFYEYIHAGKNLYFNSELEGKEIKVNYYYLNDFIQLRALLRNNVRGNVSVTPIIEDFTLKLRTI